MSFLPVSLYRFPPLDFVFRLVSLKSVEQWNSVILFCGCEKITLNSMKSLFNFGMNVWLKSKANLKNELKKSKDSNIFKAKMVSKFYLIFFFDDILKVINNINTLLSANFLLSSLNFNINYIKIIKNNLKIIYL